MDDTINDPRFVCSVREETKQKQPFKRLEFAVNRIITVAIPLHVETLKRQKEEIEKLQAQKEFLFAHSEQINASNTVRLLKSDIYELEALNEQVKSEDLDLFQQKIKQPTLKVSEAIASFLELHLDIMQPIPDIENDVSKKSEEIPTLKLYTEEENSEPAETLTTPETCEILSKEIKPLESVKISNAWLKLKAELVEVNDLIKRFANLVWSQKDSVDSIQQNLFKTHENVQSGTKYLKQAAVLKAATFPVTGAVIGGMLLGPAGAIAGFKLCGSVACAVSGGLLGYGAGWKWKQKRQLSCDIEMKALTAPPSVRSVSAPELQD